MGWRDAIARAVLGGKVGGPWEGGIRVYHSSPFDFERFSNKAIGTGEGAQTYGYGHYFAENPKVSGRGGQYWEQFQNRFPDIEQEAVQQLQNYNFDRAQAIADTQAQIADWQKHVAATRDSPLAFERDYAQKMLAGHQDILNRLQSGAPIGTRTYEVNINARPDLFLQWEKPFAQQSPPVQQVAERYLFGTPALTGEDIYRGISAVEGAQETSNLLNKAGLPGIRYLDSGSRLGGGNDRSILQNQLKATQSLHAETPTDYTTKEIARLQGLIDRTPAPTYNYVVFDPNKLDIMAKYGIVGGVPLGMGAVAAQDQYEGAQQ